MSPNISLSTACARAAPFAEHHSAGSTFTADTMYPHDGLSNDGDAEAEDESSDGSDTELEVHGS